MREKTYYELRELKYSNRLWAENKVVLEYFESHPNIVKYMDRNLYSYGRVMAIKHRLEDIAYKRSKWVSEVRYNQGYSHNGPMHTFLLEKHLPTINKLRGLSRKMSSMNIDDPVSELLGVIRCVQQSSLDIYNLKASIKREVRCRN